MDLTRSYEFFRPEKCDGRIHIIGCGAVGSAVAENIARLGLTNISLYDFDTVEPHNIANQMFTAEDIGKLKVDAVAEMMKKINPDIVEDGKHLKLYKKGWQGQRLSGYVFLAVDNIELRKQICEESMANSDIKGIFDARVSLEVGQHYAADWSKAKDMERLVGTMEFTHEEAKAAEPVSACNQPLSCIPAIRDIVTKEIANFMRMVKGEPWFHTIISNPYTCEVHAY